METVMSVNGLSCILNMPRALPTVKQYEIELTLLNETKDFVKSGYTRRRFNTLEEAESFASDLRTLNQYKDVSIIESEKPHSLPPYAPCYVHKVDEYDCPTSWMHGSGLASSYFVGVEKDKGMWLDFNANHMNSRHVAILISIQGINPLDGQSMVDIDQKISLRQYKNKCPKHDVEFRQDRYCPECNYKWVPQNYLCTTGTPSGSLWLDGFLASDGKVRQYYFTENEELGVAHQILGAEKKTYSIGIAFYLSKEQKRIPAVGYGNPLVKGLETYGAKKTWRQHYYRLKSTVSNHKMDADAPKCSFSDSPESSGLESLDSYNSVSEYDCFVKTLDIGAGAVINQQVYVDPENLDFWQDTPAGIIYINYCPSEQVAFILQKGKKDLTRKGEGFLGGLKVGK